MSGTSDRDRGNADVRPTKKDLVLVGNPESAWNSLRAASQAFRTHQLAELLASGDRPGWRSIGPSVVTEGELVATEPHVSGRVNGIAVVGQGAAQRVYAATSNGGVWRGTWLGTGASRKLKWQSLMEPEFDDRAFDLNPEEVRKGQLGKGWFHGSDSLACGAIEVVAGASAKADRIYVGSGEGHGVADTYFGVGPIVSENSGEKWTTEIEVHPPAGTPPHALLGNGFYQLAVDPDDSDLVLAATRAGLFRRQAGNPVTWERISLGTQTGAVSSVVACKQGTTTTFFAALAAGEVYRIEKTANGNALGSPTPTGFAAIAGTPQRVALAVAGSQPIVLYALTDAGTLLRHKDGAWKSVNMAKGPTDAGWNAQGTFNLAIAAHPDDANLIYLGMASKVVDGKACGALYRCQVDKVADPPQISDCLYIGQSLHADIHSLTFDAAKGLWVGCDGGVFYSAAPKGAAANLFKHCNDGLSTLTMEYIGQTPDTDLDKDPNAAHVLYCGSQDNGCVRYEGTTAVQGEEAHTWKRVHGADTGAVLVKGRGTDERILMSASLDKIWLRSGGTWYRADVPLKAYQSGKFVLRNRNSCEFYPPLATPPPSFQSDLVAFGWDSVYISEHFGGVPPANPPAPSNPPQSPQVPNEWRKMPGASQLPIGFRSLEFATDTLLYGGTRDGKVYSYAKNNGTWEETLLGTPVADAPVTSIAVDPTDNKSFYITLGGIGDHERVYRYNPASGGSWTRCGGRGKPHEKLLPVQHNAIVVHPDFKKRLYVATDIGVWRSLDRGRTWSAFSKGMPDAAVLDLKIFPPAGGNGPQPRVLRAATHGRGLFERATAREFIDILCVVDGRTLLSEHTNTTAENPHELSAAEAAKYCRIVTRDTDRVGSNASHDTVLQAQVGDQLRWRAVSLTADDQEATVTLGLTKRRLAAIEPADATICSRPAANQEKEDDLWEAEAIALGEITYQVRFTVKGTAGEAYFVWGAAPEAQAAGGNLRIKVSAADETSDDSYTSAENIEEMGSSSDAIDILCVVDGQTLFQEHPAATSLGQRVVLTGRNGIEKYCRMITRNSDWLSFNARHDLEIQAHEGVTIRWRAVSLTDDSEYKVDIRDIYDYDETLYSRPKQRGKEDVWESTTKVIQQQQRSDAYYLRFTVEHGDETRWFDWDPVITVKKVKNTG